MSQKKSLGESIIYLCIMLPIVGLIITFVDLISNPKSESVKYPGESEELRIGECIQFLGAWFWADTLVLNGKWGPIAYKRVGVFGSQSERLPNKSIKSIEFGGNEGVYWIKIKPKGIMLFTQSFTPIKFYFQKKRTCVAILQALKKSYDGVLILSLKLK